MSTKPTETLASSKHTRYAVYFPAPVGVDHKLMALVMDSLRADRRCSDFLYNLAVRGWLQVLHGLSPQERAIQLRTLDLPASVIEAIDSGVPLPQFVGLSGYPAAEPSPTPAPPLALTPAPAQEQAPVPAPEVKSPPAFGMSVPAQSRLGSIGRGGGLS